jgi:rubredoxin
MKRFFAAPMWLPSGGAVQQAMRSARPTKTKTQSFAGCRRIENFAANVYGMRSRLAVVAPQVAEEWDYQRNPRHLHPPIVIASAVEPYWWRCKGCQHRYKMSAEKRVVRGYGCPSCGHGFATNGSRAAANFPAATGDSGDATPQQLARSRFEKVVPPGERDGRLRTGLIPTQPITDD